MTKQIYENSDFFFVTFCILDILILTPFARADISTCPSSECWTWNAGTSACELKTGSDIPAECVYSVSCADQQMSIGMNDKLFGTVDGTEFGTDTCSPVWDGATSSWSWAHALGDCDQSVSRTGSGDSERIKFTKVLIMTGGSDAGLALGSANVFISTNTNSVSVTFICAFATSTTATAESINIVPHSAVSGTAAEEEGTWTGSLVLKYYTTSAFTTELDTSSSSTIFIGATMFVQSEWSVSTLSGKLQYYIDTCTIRDVPSDGSAGGTTVAIVKESCYSSAVGAAPLGGKMVDTNGQFQYTSFSFDTASADDQELECTIKFCLVGVSGDCPDIATTDDQCPADVGFAYLA